MIKNIFLTGKSGCGKSSLINEIIKELRLTYSGYRTLPYCINGHDRGYYLHGYVDVENNFSPISVKIGNKLCYSINETFENLGCLVLKKSRDDVESDIILMDEVGTLENEASNFKAEVINTLDSEKFVLGVIKTKENTFLNGIVTREDTLILDLEKLNRDKVKNKVISVIKINNI